MQNKYAQILFSSALLALLAGLLGFSILQCAQHPAFVNYTSVKYAAITLLGITGVFIFANRVLKQTGWVLGLIPVAVIVSGKGLALLSAGIFLLACLGLGLSIYRWFDQELNFSKGIIAFFIGFTANSYGLWLALHVQVNFPWVYYLLFLAEIVVFRQPLLKLLTTSKNSLKIHSWTPAQMVLMAAGLFYLGYALVPHYVWDELLRHLYFPKYVRLHGMMEFTPRVVMSLDTTVMAQGSYAAVFLMADEYAIRLLNLALFFTGFLLLVNFIENKFGKRTALFALLSVLTAPFILWQMDVFIDSFEFLSAAILFVFIFEVAEVPDRAKIILYFILAALAYLCKQQAVFIIVPTAAILLARVLVHVYQTRTYRLLAAGIWGSVIFAALLSLPLLQNYLLAGNPLFPFYNGIFKSPWFQPGNFVDLRWAHPVNIKALYEITFHGSQYLENMDFSFGITYFVLAVFFPLLFWGKDRRKEILLVLFIFLATVVLWIKITKPYIRYFVTCMPAGAVCLGLVSDRILQIVQKNKFACWAAWGLFGVLFALNGIMQMSIVNFTSPYPLIEALTGNYQRSNYQYYQEVKKVYDYANIKYGRQGRGLLVNGTPYLYFADFQAETLAWYHYQNQQEYMACHGDPQQTLDWVFKKKKYDFIIAQDVSDPQYPGFYAPEFMRHVQKEFASSGYALFSYRPESQATLK